MVTELGLPEAAIDYAAELEECAFGAREGLTRPEIRARFPDDWAARDADRWNVPATGGDSHADVHARVSPWYASLVRDVPMLVVCHGLTSRVLRGIHAGLSPAEVHALDQPQDGFFELAGRSIRFLD